MKKDKFTTIALYILLLLAAFYLLGHPDLLARWWKTFTSYMGGIGWLVP